MILFKNYTFIYFFAIICKEFNDRGGDMKKVYKILIPVILIILVICIWLFLSKKDNDDYVLVDNIEGKYSEVKITDFETAKASLEDVKEDLRINSIKEDLKEDTINQNSAILNTYKLNQTFNGIDVYNAGMIVYTDKDGNAAGVINKYKPISDFNTTPKHKGEELEQKATESLEDEYNNLNIIDNSLVIYPLENGNYTLAYLYQIDIGLSTATVIVNDETTEILETKIPTNEIVSDSLSEFKVDEISKQLATEKEYNINTSYALIDKDRKIILSKINSMDEPFELYDWNSNEEAKNTDNQLGITTMNTVQQCYDYYKEKFEYISFDNGKKDVTIQVATGLPTFKGKKATDQAYCSAGEYIFLGSDNIYNDDVEVVGHEFTHGIFYHIVGDVNESNYEGWAINEAYADMMGMCIEAYYNQSTEIDGYINESKEKSGVKRNIKKTSNKYKENKKDRGLTKEEHTDSTIISRAAYKMAENLTLQEFETLWFNSMYLLPKEPNFYDCRYAVEQTAKLMNLSEEKQKMIAEAFNEVGITRYYNAKYYFEQRTELPDVVDRIDDEVKNENNHTITEKKELITIEQGLSLVTNLIRKFYSTASIETIEVDITQGTINNESHLNYFTYRVGLDSNFYTLVVNKSTSKIYLYEEQNTGSLQELTEQNLTQFIKEVNNTIEGTSSGLQVGDYTLNYGTYKGTDAQYDVGGVISWDITITLKEDGTYSLTSSNQEMEKNSNGTYSITDKYGFTAILLSSQRIFSVIDNNTLQVPAGSGATFTYQGN